MPMSVNIFMPHPSNSPLSAPLSPSSLQSSMVAAVNGSQRRRNTRQRHTQVPPCSPLASPPLLHVAVGPPLKMHPFFRPPTRRCLCSASASPVSAAPCLASGPTARVFPPVPALQ
ncbi:hypothetical protein S83_043631 [Arachis hypogaea]